MSTIQTQRRAIYGMLTGQKEARPTRVIAIVEIQDTLDATSSAKLLELFPVRVSASRAQTTQNRYLFFLKKTTRASKLKSLTMKTAPLWFPLDQNPVVEVAQGIKKETSYIQKTVTFLKDKKGNLIFRSLGSVESNATIESTDNALLQLVEGMVEDARMALSKRAMPLTFEEAHEIISSDNPYVKVNGCRCELVNVHPGTVRDRKTGGRKNVLNFLCAYTENGVKIPFSTTRAYRIEKDTSLPSYRPKTIPSGFHLGKLVQFAIGVEKFSTLLNRKNEPHHGAAIEIAKKLVEAGLMILETKEGKGKKTTTFRYTTNPQDPRCSEVRKVGKNGQCHLVSTKNADDVITVICEKFADIITTPSIAAYFNLQ